ncbi:hypothetical protein BJX99DRAFT_259349 [Aspergillus californicus]
MSHLERKVAALQRIIHQTSIRYLCPICLKGFSRPDTLYDHFRKEQDDIHKGLCMRKSDFKRFLSSYQAALGASIPAAELPFNHKCFDLQYVLERRCQDSAPSISLHSHGRPGLYAALAHCDREPRGHGMDLARFRWARPLGDVEIRIRALLPQLENWLIGTLPPSMPGESHHSDDPGILLPTVDIDIPLVPIRDMLYQGFGIYTLLRTYKETTTPLNFCSALYTVLRVDEPAVIGHREVSLGQSIWVGRQSALSAGLIVLVCKSPDTSDDPTV